MRRRPKSKFFRGDSIAKKKAPEPKLEDASGEPTVEYLTAFHNYVKGHKDVYDHIKAEVHLKARGSAGGTIKAKKRLALIDTEIDPSSNEGPPPEDDKITNAAPTESQLIETDDYFETSVVLAREGVWTGTDGEPRFKPFDALRDSAKWMLGAPITNGHVSGNILPSTRRIGQIVNVEARPDKKDVFGTARFYKNGLRDDELDLLRSGNPIDGSIGYRTPLKHEPGVWNDQNYLAVETGPFVLEEYAILPGGRGACSASDGCGIFQNAAGVDVPDDKAKTDNSAKGDNVTEVDFTELETKFQKQLNEAVSRLEAEIVTRDAKIAELEGAHKTLNEAFEAKKTAEAAAKSEADRAKFAKLLNAAAAADPAEVEKMFNAYMADPVGWTTDNRKKLLVEVDPKKADGKQFNAGGQDALAVAKSKTDEIMFKRR